MKFGFESWVLGDFFVARAAAAEAEDRTIANKQNRDRECGARGTRSWRLAMGMRLEPRYGELFACNHVLQTCVKQRRQCEDSPIINHILGVLLSQHLLYR